MKSSPRIAKLRITDLRPHPLNPNKMPPDHQVKLEDHIRRTENYPPLIVRLHPTEKSKYQIIDGQHRAEALSALGYKLAQCAIWEVDDTETKMLLATLNRLEGQDDPYLRGTLLSDLAQQFEVSQLAEQLPLDAAAIRKYIAAADSPPAPSAPQSSEDMPHALTIFLTMMERDQVLVKLKTYDLDRGQALLRALHLLPPDSPSRLAVDAPATPNPS